MTFNPNEHDGFILLRLDNFIMRNETLNLEEKLYLSLAFGFTAQGKCMFASKDWIAYKFGWSPVFVEEMERKLARQGFIKIRRGIDARSVTFVLDDWEDPCQEESADLVFDVTTIETE